MASASSGIFSISFKYLRWPSELWRCGFFCQERIQISKDEVPMLWSPYTALHPTGITAAGLALAAMPNACFPARHPHSKGHPASARADAAITCSSRHLQTVKSQIRFQNHNAATRFPALQVIQGAQSSHYKVSP